MPRPSGQELGLRSPLTIRGGIDIPNWEGINRQNDPGAIRDSQFYDLVNVRLSGNEIISRGGQEKIHTGSAMTGCVFGFVDVPEGTTSLLLVANSDLGASPTEARLDRYYSEGLDRWTTIFAQSATLQGLPTDVVSGSGWGTETVPRRALVRFSGSIYQFGDAGGSEKRLYRIVLPERTATLTGTNSFANQCKLEPALEVAEFASAVTRDEANPDGEPVETMYIGSTSTASVYRWDGQTLTTETSGLGAVRHIMARYQEDIYAWGSSGLRKRSDGAWNVSFSLPSAEVMIAAEEYQTVMFASGGNKVFSFNGTSVSDVSASINAVLGGATIYRCVDIRSFNGNVYFLISDTTGVTQSTSIVRYNGSTYTLVANILVLDGPTSPGCFEAVGAQLFFTISSEPSTAPELYVMDTSESVSSLATIGNIDEPAPSDMRAF